MVTSGSYCNKPVISASMVKRFCAWLKTQATLAWQRLGCAPDRAMPSALPATALS